MEFNYHYEDIYENSQHRSKVTPVYGTTLSYKNNEPTAIVSWEPEWHYYYSTLFHWESEGCYCCTKPMAKVPFLLSTEHRWTVLMPFWFSAEDIVALVLTFGSFSNLILYIWRAYFQKGLDPLSWLQRKTCFFVRVCTHVYEKLNIEFTITSFCSLYADLKCFLKVGRKLNNVVILVTRFWPNMDLAPFGNKLFIYTCVHIYHVFGHCSSFVMYNM